MDSEIAKSRPLSKEETKALLGLIEKSHIITTKATNATNNKLKNVEWSVLAERFNATATNCPRTPQQLRLKWENLKKTARKRYAKIRSNHLKTGGGPPEYIPPDDILDRVADLLGSTVSGFTVPFGGDRESENFFVVRGDEVKSDNGGGRGDGSVICSGEGKTTEDIGVNLDEYSSSIQSCMNNGIVVANCQVVTDVIHVPDETPSSSTKLTFSTPRTAKKKVRDENRSARNLAVAEYYSAKRQCLDAKLNSIISQNENFKLQNESLKLQTEILKLQNENLKLQNEKLKLELDKLNNP